MLRKPNTTDKYIESRVGYVGVRCRVALVCFTATIFVYSLLPSDFRPARYTLLLPAMNYSSSYPETHASRSLLSRLNNLLLHPRTCHFLKDIYIWHTSRIRSTALDLSCASRGKYADEDAYEAHHIQMDVLLKQWTRRRINGISTDDHFNQLLVPSKFL